MLLVNLCFGINIFSNYEMNKRSIGYGNYKSFKNQDRYLLKNGVDRNWKFRLQLIERFIQNMKPKFNPMIIKLNTDKYNVDYLKNMANIRLG